MITLAVFGATGFQGGLTLERLQQLNSDDVRPVLIGRNSERLAAAAARTGLEHAEQRVVTDVPSALPAALADCDVVINCAGPFTGGLADRVIAAAIECGTHYVDTAGEQPYIKHVFDDWDSHATDAGVTVMPATNDAVLPTDLLATIMAERFGPLADLTITHAMTGGGGMSRGSLRSLLAVPELSTGGGGYLYRDGSWIPAVPASPSTIAMPDRPEPMPAAAFPMIEALTIPRHLDVGSVSGYIDAAVLDRLKQPIDPAVIERLPEGPSIQARSTQQFCYVVDARTRQGDRRRGGISGRDTYKTTAAIAVLAAEQIARHSTPAGVLAPGEAFDPVAFLSGLAGVDLHWDVA